MDELQLQTYLNAHIPLSEAMGVRVASAGPEAVVLEAPLGPNINHRETVFGGSVSALAILAGWSLVHVRFASSGRSCRIVIQRNRMEYDAPAPGAFSASTAPVEAEAWARLDTALEKRGKARIDIACTIESAGAPCGRFWGTFVVIDTARQLRQG